MQLQKVLVPLDGSMLAEQVVPYASGLAQGLGAPLHLVTVISPTEQASEASVGNVAMMGPQAGPIATADAGAAEAERLSPVPAERAEQYVRNVSLRLQSEGAVATYEVRTGQPADEILAAADQQGVGLIAIASHGRSGWRRAVFGSVADELLRRSGLPVLVIKAEQTDRS